MTNHIFITGLPSVGKTTLIKKVIDIIEDKYSHRFTVKGFYTQEVRSATEERIGFDIIDITNPLNRKQLARIDFNSGPKVGKYFVDLHSFESIAIPLLNISKEEIELLDKSNKQMILVIDEIGKMETFSDVFRKSVRQMFDNEVTTKSYRIMATLPVKRNVQLAEDLRRRSGSDEIHINRSNRNSMADRVVNMLCENAIR
ncbi:cancer-related nucleoside-triphosphatase homolog [Oppia nitens]|uniref:cancer-related nucleoside-triphosphatase homolog n=1 Tax=Oppia nitens TaxID=1686743 RepID=UPI0023DA03CF|nr:cancer-related nucleoside-triphosphatase homolog [Oppia nitens]XP_054163147.1 cancer-related nucleoside-triphosphatase homolog [Oppia nitens]